MDLESKRVWDYAGDAYVHRIIQDAAKPGEKLVELPGRRREPTALEGQEDIEVAKMDNIALEYTHLLTSQLESQRVYFEEVVERAVDKASEANKKAERAMDETRVATERLRVLETEHDVVSKGLVPELEKEKARLEIKSAKFEEMARSFGQKYQDEKALTNSLMKKIEFFETNQLRESQTFSDTIQHLREELDTKDLLMQGLMDEHRDAMMQISAQKKLQEMVANGELDQADLDGAVIEAGPAAKKLPVRRGRRAAANGPVRSPASPALGQLVPNRPSGSSEKTTDDATLLYNNIFGECSRSKSWDDEKVKSILDEARAKLLGEGLLATPTEISGQTQVETEGSSDAEEDGEGKSKVTGTAKKKKGKRKAKK